MTAWVTSADHVAPQRWRHGGGRTRELLAWPSAPHWMLRISLADITLAAWWLRFDSGGAAA